MKKDNFEKIVNAVQKHSYQCKICGRKDVIRFDQNRTICSHCGHLIFKKESDEFKYYLLKAIKEGKTK